MGDHVVKALQKKKLDAVISIDNILSASSKERVIHGFDAWKSIWENYKVLNAGQKEAMRLFDVFDADGDGELTMDELSFRMSDWGHEQEDIDKVMLKCDVNNDGIITWDEFLSRFHLIRETLGIGAEDEEA